MPFAEDLSVFFQSSEFASTATWGGLTANVIFDSPAQDILGGRGISTEYTAVLPAAEFPDIARGDEVTIAGAVYTLREYPRLLDDGATKQLILSKT